jgi:hypothetical protein
LNSKAVKPPKQEKKKEQPKKREIWFEPGQIRYWKKHVQFVLANFPEILTGRWPAQTTGYYDAGGRSPGFSSRAQGESVRLIGLEVDERLKNCGPDGAMVRAYYRYGIPIKTIAEACHCTQDDCQYRMNRAIRCAASGPVRRWMDTTEKPGITYSEFCNHLWAKWVDGKRVLFKRDKEDVYARR